MTRWGCDFVLQLVEDSSVEIPTDLSWSDCPQCAVSAPTGALSAHGVATNGWRDHADDLAEID